MMGCAGATGTLGYTAWILGIFLFLWQIPHFLALAWLYREDYARGGFLMIPSIDPSGLLTGMLACLYILALLPLGLAMMMAGLAGWIFVTGSLLLGAGLLYLGLRLFRNRSVRNARRLFLGTIIYLTLLLGLRRRIAVPPAGWQRPAPRAPAPRDSSRARDSGPPVGSKSAGETPCRARAVLIAPARASV